jgi:phosphoribosylamine--glycine ligase
VRVLLLGSGGREHALARALAADPDVTGLHAAPGNPGIAALAELHPADLADVGAVTGLSCFGPGRRAAMIEGSKSFAKQVMTAAGIPTAQAVTCGTEAEVARALERFGPPYVVKADGLAGGKGVVVTGDRAAALAHGQAAGKVVVEEFLDGPEVSLFALADGASAVPLLPAQDFKRAEDGDEGPNTGGMGAYAPLPWAPAGLTAELMATVIEPAIGEMRRRGTPYRGLLYAGLALTSRGPRVVEFNARFGDPETQVVLDRLATPLAGPLAAAASGSLSGAGPLQWAPGAAVTVVIAAAGYPVSPLTADVIEGIDDAERLPGAYVLHAGTGTDRGGRLVSTGGRVLNVVGTGADLQAARSVAYQAAERIRMRGGWFRRDIAAVAARTAPSPA